MRIDSKFKIMISSKSRVKCLKRPKQARFVAVTDRAGGSWRADNLSRYVQKFCNSHLSFIGIEVRYLVAQAGLKPSAITQTLIREKTC